MRPVLFVVCFCLGVSLMVASGYLPKSATGQTNHAAAGNDSGAKRPGVDWPEPVFTGAPTVPRALLPADEPPEPPRASPEIYTSPPVRLPGDATVAPDVPDAGEAAAEPAEMPVEEPENGLSAERAAKPPPAAEPSDESDPPPPIAVAGAHRIVWSGWGDLILDGSGSTGEGLSFRWRQVGGAQRLRIADPRAARTTAAGLEADPEAPWDDATYEFELTVVDVLGREATDRVTYTVRPAPLMDISPAGERRFEDRDGYPLAHYESWIATAASRATFEIVSLSPLTFTRAGGARYTLRSAKVGEGYVYTLTLYPQRRQPTTWVELLVESEEKIPAVVQLGVEWGLR